MKLLKVANYLHVEEVKELRKQIEENDHPSYFRI